MNFRNPLSIINCIGQAPLTTEKPARAAVATSSAPSASSSPGEAGRHRRAQEGRARARFREWASQVNPANMFAAKNKLQKVRRGPTTVDRGMQTPPEVKLPLSAVTNMASSLGPANNRDAVRARQDFSIAEEFMKASKVQLPTGTKASEFVYNPYDLAIIDLPGGKKGLFAFEFNDTGYAGVSSAPEHLQQLWLERYREIGCELLDEHRKSGRYEPLLVLVGSSGREDDNEKNKGGGKTNNKTFSEKAVIAATMADAMKGETMDLDTARNFYRTEQKQQSGNCWPPKKPLVLAGYSKELTDEIEVRNGRPYLFGVPVKLVVNGRTAANMQKTHPDLDPTVFPRTNLTNEIGTDKGSFMQLMYEFNRSGEAKDIGTAYGLETPQRFARVEQVDNDKEASMEKLVDAVVDMLEKERNEGTGRDMMVKPSGTGHGIGIRAIGHDASREQIRSILDQADQEVFSKFGKGAGFPWAIQPRINPTLVDGREQELRMVSFVHKGNMCCVPVIFKKGNKKEEGNDAFVPTNISAQDKHLSNAEKEDPHYLSTLVDPALNAEIWEKYGLEKKELLSTARYLSKLSVFALRTAMEQRENAVAAKRERRLVDVERRELELEARYKDYEAKLQDLCNRAEQLDRRERSLGKRPEVAP